MPVQYTRLRWCGKRFPGSACWRRGRSRAWRGGLRPRAGMRAAPRAAVAAWMPLCDADAARTTSMRSIERCSRRWRHLTRACALAALAPPREGACSRRWRHLARARALTKSGFVVGFDGLRSLCRALASLLFGSVFVLPGQKVVLPHCVFDDARAAGSDDLKPSKPASKAGFSCAAWRFLADGGLVRGLALSLA